MISFFDTLVNVTVTVCMSEVPATLYRLAKGLVPMIELVIQVLISTGPQLFTSY